MASIHPQKYTWLLFDADDTLFDFLKAEANALKWTLEQSGVPFLEEYFQRYARFNQQVWKEFERGEIHTEELREKRFRLFFEDIGQQGDMAVISRLYLANLALQTDLLEGAEQIITRCKEQYHLALVTNGLRDVQIPRLNRSALKDAFEHVFISEVIGAAKPTRAFFDIVFEKLGHPNRQSVLIIGDSLSSDIQGGLSYGIDTCWLNPRNTGTDLPVTYQIQQLHQLSGILNL